jgi:hypothetical protein
LLSPRDFQSAYFSLQLLFFSSILHYASSHTIVTVWNSRSRSVGFCLPVLNSIVLIVTEFYRVCFFHQLIPTYRWYCAKLYLFGSVWDLCSNVLFEASLMSKTMFYCCLRVFTLFICCICLMLCFPDV